MVIEHDAWLAGLQKGDDVIVLSGFIHDTPRLRKLTHVTPKQVGIANDRYWRKNGRRVGSDGIYRSRLTAPTPELIEKIKRDHALSRLRYETWDKYPNALLFAVLALVEGATGGAVDPVGEKVTSGPRA